MLDLSNEQAIWKEVEAAENWRDLHVKTWKTRIARFHGTAFKVCPEYEDWRELFYHKYTSLIVPRCISREPRVATSTSLPQMFGETAEGLGHALNRWIQLSRVALTYTEVAYDYLMLWGVTLQTSKIVYGGDTDDPWAWPEVTRLPPDWYFMDAAAKHKDRARLQGHQWVIDKDDLVSMAKDADEEDGWDLTACETMQPMSGDDFKKLGRDPSVKVDRNELIVRDLWFPEVVWDTEQKDVGEGYNGGCMTLGYGPKSGPRVLRKLRPFYGPRTGPYALYGYHKVPDDPYPLSPLVAVESQIERLNRRKKQSQDSAEAYKRLLIVGGPKANLAQQIKDKPDWYVFWAGVDFEKNKSETLEIAGESEQNIVSENRERDETERSSGLTEALQGNIEGVGTAHEVQGALDAAQVRMGHISGQFMVGMEDSIRGVAWYVLLDDRQKIPLGQEAATAEAPNPVWQGGVDGEAGEAIDRLQDPFDAVQVSVKPYSTEPVTQGQRTRSADVELEMVANVAPLMPQMPYVKWPEWAKRQGELRGIDGLEELFDFEKLGQAQQMAAEQAKADLAASQPEAGQQPRSKALRGTLGQQGMGGGSRPANKPRNDMRHVQGGMSRGSSKQKAGA